MKKKADLTVLAVTQYLDSMYWSKADSRLNTGLMNSDSSVILDWVVERLNSQWGVLEANAIVHDRDTRTVYNELTRTHEIEVKKPHVHIVVKLDKNNNKGANTATISDCLGIEEQFVERPKTGRYAYVNMLAYLIHAKDSDKYQYVPDDVSSYNNNYVDIYNEYRDDWRVGSLKKKKNNNMMDIENMKESILRGELTKEEVLLTDELYYVYASDKRVIDEAFNTYFERKIYRAIERLKSGEFSTKVYYVMGQAGAGKTRYVSKLAKQIQETALETLGEQWSICQTASTNPVDDYNSDEILIMDDVRGSTMRADDWLKLLDPYNSSPSSARYKNKIVVARAIFITATISPIEFFYYTKGVGKGEAQSEAIDQFLRRLSGLINVINYDPNNENICNISFGVPKKSIEPVHYRVGGSDCSDLVIEDPEEWRERYTQKVVSNIGIEQRNVDVNKLTEHIVNRVIDDKKRLLNSK